MGIQLHESLFRFRNYFLICVVELFCSVKCQVRGKGDENSAQTSTKLVTISPFFD